MATATNKTVNEIKSYLTSIFNNENVQDFSIKILGNAEKGDGFIGDIVFAQVTAVTKTGTTREYNLVLKCSKKSQALREKSPVKETFLNEIYIYDFLLPSFAKFQLDKSVKKPFDSVPKCYGTFVGDNTEIIVLENLKRGEYNIWDKTKPMTRKHIELVVSVYGKFHAISIGMKDQKPKEFEKLVSGLDDLVVKFVEMTGMQSVFEANVEEIHNLLKNHFEETILSKWITLKRQIHSIFRNVDLNELNVVTHGDCWNNNFMFYYDNKKSDLPVKVNVLDWQMARLSSPVCDLAYFIFACISEEDLNSLNAILELYYRSLGETLRELGSDPEKLYPSNDFLDHWKKYSKFGVVMASLIIKMCFSERDEIPDMAQTAESGNDISATFSINIKDKTSFINRISYIVKYVVEHDLI